MKKSGKRRHRSRGELTLCLLVVMGCMGVYGMLMGIFGKYRCLWDVNGYLWGVWVFMGC